MCRRRREPAERWYFERYVAPYLNDRLRFVGGLYDKVRFELPADGGVAESDVLR